MYHSSRTRRILLTGALALVGILTAGSLTFGQVHYHEDGRPWKQRAQSGPDAEVEGWYYNLGVTGIRVELTEEAPNFLLVRHVFEGSPAYRRVKSGDWIIGVGGKKFETPHQNGYGMKVFGARGPIADFAAALEACQEVQAKGSLELAILRGKKERKATLKIDTDLGAFSPSYPAQCEKSDKLFEKLCDYLVEHQQRDGSWGSAPHDTFAPLALLASGDKKYRKALLKNVRMHAKTTSAKDSSWLINWRYMAAAIVMSEYYLATGDKWLVDELQEVYDFLISSQYVDLKQVDEKSKVDRPGDMPKNAMDSHGGWGHNPGFEGYGPICMLTGQGALAFALMKRCGIEVDRERHEAALAFLARGTGKNDYVWYEDSAAGAEDWADMGRTGAAGLAYLLSPYQVPAHRERALAYAKVIGAHPQSFPDTHGSPVMGMAYAAMAAAADEDSFRALLDANRWWFTLSQCQDDSFYYQPNRDNAGYGADSRISASAATALILAIPRRNLHLTGKPFPD